MTAPVLQLERVSLIYEDPQSSRTIGALEGVDLEVRDKEFLVVVGPSGCGKSTLLKLMVGLLQPSSGRILHRATPLDGTLKDVGMVYQSPLLLPWRSVIDNVLLPIEILHLDRQQYLPVAHKLLDTTGLSAFSEYFPRQLSGGMQQRVALCRALISDPPLLLMDEPFGALDALTRDEMGQELERLWARQKKTVVFVTHGIAEAVFLADRVIVMSPRPGRIMRDIRIELPRPREEARKHSERFAQYIEAIRETIYSFKRS